MPCDSMARAATVERRTHVATRRAPIVAEVADVRSRIHVRGAAPHAVLRVCRMLERCAALRGVVDTERRRVFVRPGEIRHQRIVRVDDEKRLFGKGRDHRPPALGDELQLPVAVELVAKEIAEAHDARPDGSGQVGQRRLVHLEQAQLGIACVDEGRRDPRGEVRAGGVVGQPEAGSKDRRRHRGARRLAVGRGQDHAPFGQTLRKPPDRPGVDCGQQLPRQRRPAALPREARQVTRRPRKGRLHREPHGRECRSLQRVISSTIPRRRDDFEAIRAERVVGGSDNCNGVACAPGQYSGGSSPAGRGGHRRDAPRDLRTSCIRGRVGSIHRPRAGRGVGACVHRPCRPRPCRSWGSSPRPAGGSSPAPTRSSCLAGTRRLGAALGRVAARPASHPRIRTGNRGCGRDVGMACRRRRRGAGVGAPRRGSRLGARRHGRLRGVRGDGPAFCLRQWKTHEPPVVHSAAQPRYRAPARGTGSCAGGRVPDEPVARSVRCRTTAAASPMVRDSAARASGQARCQDRALQRAVLRAGGRS